MKARNQPRIKPEKQLTRVNSFLSPPSDFGHRPLLLPPYAGFWFWLGLVWILAFSAWFARELPIHLRPPPLLPPHSATIAQFRLDLDLGFWLASGSVPFDLPTLPHEPLSNLISFDFFPPIYNAPPSRSHWQLLQHQTRVISWELFLRIILVSSFQFLRRYTWNFSSSFLELKVFRSKFFNGPSSSPRVGIDQVTLLEARSYKTQSGMSVKWIRDQNSIVPKSFLVLFQPLRKSFSSLEELKIFSSKFFDFQRGQFQPRFILYQSNRSSSLHAHEWWKRITDQKLIDPKSFLSSFSASQKGLSSFSRESENVRGRGNLTGSHYEDNPGRKDTNRLAVSSSPQCNLVWSFSLDHGIKAEAHWRQDAACSFRLWEKKCLP